MRPATSLRKFKGKLKDFSIASDVRRSLTFPRWFTDVLNANKKNEFRVSLRVNGNFSFLTDIHTALDI